MSSDSYVESAVPKGFTALVAGGTGNVGRYVVRGLLASGATVIVPSRSQEKLTALQTALADVDSGRLTSLRGDVSDENEAVRLRDQALRSTGRLDAVVAALGKFAPAPSLAAATRASLERVLDDYLVAHFVVARTFLPALQGTSGSYTFINGMLAFTPTPGSGLVSVATAGQRMLARVLMNETADAGVRVNELVLHVGIGWGSAEESDRNGRLVARQVADIVVGTAACETFHLTAEGVSSDAAR